MKAFSVIHGHYRIDTDENGDQTIRDLSAGRTWGGMHISAQNNAGDAVDQLLEEEAMGEEDKK